MQANYVQRLRLTFEKTGPTRYIGHLDLAKTLERSFNRAKIPLAYSQGFNPQPRMQLATPLPLGCTSGGELADIWLKEELEPEAAQAQMMACMAPGIDIYKVKSVDPKSPALQTLTRSSLYKVTLLDPVNTAVLQERIAVLMASESHIRRRATGKKRKEYDLRPLILALSLDLSGNLPVIHTELSQMPAKTGRPDELLLTLEIDPLAARIHRKKIVLAE